MRPLGPRRLRLRYGRCGRGAPRLLSARRGLAWPQKDTKLSRRDNTQALPFQLLLALGNLAKPNECSAQELHVCLDFIRTEC